MERIMIKWNSLHTLDLYKKGKFLWMAVLIIIRGLLTKSWWIWSTWKLFFFFFQNLLPSSLPATGPRLARLYIGFVHLPSSLFFVGNSIPSPLGILFTCCYIVGKINDVILTFPAREWPNQTFSWNSECHAEWCGDGKVSKGPSIPIVASCSQQDWEQFLFLRYLGSHALAPLGSQFFSSSFN